MACMTWPWPTWHLHPPVMKEQPTIINLYAQFDMGKPCRKRPFAFPPGVYDAARQRKKWFWQGLQQIATMKQRPKSVVFADHIGCQHGGGRWADCLAMIQNFADHNPDIRVWLVQYDPEADNHFPQEPWRCAQLKQITSRTSGGCAPMGQ